METIQITSSELSQMQELGRGACSIVYKYGTDFVIKALNEKGIEQAKDVKDKLKNKQIDLILCSPLIRAVETANIINDSRNIPILIDEKLSERDFGEFEGMPTTDFDYEAFWSYKQNIQYNKAENIKDFFQRVYGFLDNIYLKYKDKRILLVAHGGISIPVYCYFNGIPDKDTLLGLALGNCEVAKYVYKEKEIDER